MSDVPPPNGDDGVDAELDELGRRIGEARASADRRTDDGDDGGAGGRWLIVLVVALVLAVIVGVLVIASGGGDDDEATVGGATTTVEVTTTSAGETTTTVVEATTTTAEATTTTTTPPAPPSPPPPPPSPPPPSESDDGPLATIEVTVSPGDSFWAIAERAASERLGRPATDAEIAPLWLDFVDANLDRLVEPGNPDLILPGQILLLPGATAAQ